MILITGAAGKTGRTIIAALRKRQVPIRALVLLNEHEQLLRDLGAAEVVVGDMGETAVIESAARGIDTIYYICSNVNPDELIIGEKVIAAASKAGTSHFVYHSVLHPQIEAMPHHWLKMRVEEALIKSGLPFTILQPTAYMQNIFQAWEVITSQGHYAVPYHPQTRLSIVDLEDVAEVAVRVMTEPAPHVFATFELSGAQAFSQIEVAEILSRELHRPVTAVYSPRDQWMEQMKSIGMDNFARETLLKMFEYYEQHGFHGNPQTLSHLLQRSPTTLEEVVRRHILMEKENNG